VHQVEFVSEGAVPAPQGLGGRHRQVLIVRVNFFLSFQKLLLLLMLL
jgi:hypothetical protein